MRTQTRGTAANTDKTTSGAKPAAVNTTRVCISTAEKIAHLADQHHQPPAAIAGALAEIGIELLSTPERAIAAGTTFDALIMTAIQRGTRLPKPKCVIPILITDYTHESSRAWAKDVGCTLDEWLRVMVEIGIAHYAKRGLLKYLLPDAEAAFFLTLSQRIKDDCADSPAAAALLKPAPALPPALISFERILAAKRGED